MKNTEIIRIPRPMGITQLMAEYSVSKDAAILDKVQTYLIQQWLISNGKLCGRHLSILELSNFLKCPAERIRTHMRDQLLETRIWDKSKQEEILNSIMGQQLTWALEDRMEVEAQLSLLKDSQKGQYTPFISSEVAKAIDLKLKTTGSLQNIIRNMGGGSVNIFQQFNQQNINQQETITIDQAIQIIQDENSKVLENKDKELKYIENTYDVEEFPEVVATKQIGVNTDKEGLNLNSAELKQITDNYKETALEADNLHHELRREIELQIDTEAEDPELDIYPG